MPRTTTSSWSKAMSAFRPMSTPRPVQSRVTRNVTSTAAKKGVPTARVRDAHYQPERDRQVQRRKRLGVAARGEWIDVGEYTRRDERDGQPAESAGVESPFPDEIAGQERQHEETQIAGVEAGVLVQLDPEEGRHLDDHGRRHRKTEGDDSIRSGPRSWLPGVRGRY